MILRFFLYECTVRGGPPGNGSWCTPYITTTRLKVTFCLPISMGFSRRPTSSHSFSWRWPNLLAGSSGSLFIRFRTYLFSLCLKLFSVVKGLSYKITNGTTRLLFFVMGVELVSRGWFRGNLLLSLLRRDYLSSFICLHWVLCKCLDFIFTIFHNKSYSPKLILSSIFIFD